MSEHLDKLLEQTSVLRGALEGESPSGTDLALEPEFGTIKSEIEKLTNLDGTEVDWRVVVDGSEELLSTKTKDLRLAVWMTAGALERSGWRGLARGLVVCRGIVAELWDSVFPKRDKARANIVIWLGERVAPLLPDLRVTLEDGDDVRLCAELVAEIDRTLADKLGDAFSGIRGLVSATKARVRDIPEPPPPPPPRPEPAASEWADDDDPAPAAPPPEATPAPQAGSVRLSLQASDAEATTRTCGETLSSLARSMILVAPTRGWAYRLHREGLWLPFEHVTVNDGVVASPGPDAGTRELLQDLFSSSRWQELAVAGEEASARSPLWLDPHRFVARALERMGSAFVDAREAVGRTTSDFVRRHMFLLECTFEDGGPIARPETIEWLELEAKRWQIGSRATEVARDEDRDLAARFAEASELVAAGRHAEGLAIAVQLSRRGADPRERFRSSLDVANLAINAGAHEVARSILEGLVKVAETHGLETWEPSLCARLYASLHRCTPVDAPERARVFEILCRLDPGAAVRASGPAPKTRTPVRLTTPLANPVPSPAAAPVTNGNNAPAVAPPPAPNSPPGYVESEWADDD